MEYPYILGALSALLLDASMPGTGDIRASLARGLNGNVNYLTTEPLKVNVSSRRACSREAGLSGSDFGCLLGHQKNNLISIAVIMLRLNGTNFGGRACSYAASAWSAISQMFEIRQAAKSFN